MRHPGGLKGKSLADEGIRVPMSNLNRYLGLCSFAPANPNLRSPRTALPVTH